MEMPSKFVRFFVTETTAIVRSFNEEYLLRSGRTDL